VRQHQQLLVASAQHPAHPRAMAGRNSSQQPLQQAEPNFVESVRAGNRQGVDPPNDMPSAGERNQTLLMCFTF